MGYMRHHAIIITSYNESDAVKAHYRASIQCGFHVCQISNIVQSVINGYFSFFVGPDGSKEGWDDSNTGDQRRADFIRWLENQRHLDWIELQYGDDGKMSMIVRHSDEIPNEED